jgi:hypothetical protein
LAKAARALELGHEDEAMTYLPVPGAEMSDTDTGSGPKNTQPIPVVDQGIPRKIWVMAIAGGVTLIALVIGSIALINAQLEPADTTPVVEEPVVVEEPTPDDPAPVEEPVVEEPAAPEPEPEPEIVTVTVPESEIVGKTEAQVTELLLAKGLRLDAITGNIAPSKDKVGVAYRVNPTGTVADNTLIAVYFYAPIPSPPAPSALAVTPAEGPYAPGDDITISWPAYAQCPSGFPVTNYLLEIVGGTLNDEDDAALPAGSTSASITLGAAGEFRASYVVTCTSINTPKSAVMTVAITEPVDETAPAE